MRFERSELIGGANEQEGMRHRLGQDYRHGRRSGLETMPGGPGIVTQTVIGLAVWPELKYKLP